MSSTKDGAPADLKQTVQQQASTIESLHAAAQKYKTQMNQMEQQLKIKEAEIGSLRLLSQENVQLREDNLKAHERIRELELNSSRLAEQSYLGAESQAQLGVKLQAYQRHNAFLQGEISSRETRLKCAQEHVDVLKEELHAKDRRISILVEKLRRHNIDPTSSVQRIQVPEETFSQMKDRLVTQETTLELMREKLETTQEDLLRKEELLGALQKENKALKGTISRLIAQINGSVEVAAAAARQQQEGQSDGSSSPPRTDLERKLAAYRNRKVDEGSNEAEERPA